MSQAKITTAIIICLSFLYTIPKPAYSAPTYVYSDCPNTTLFTNNSNYEKRLNTVFHSLTTNSTANSNGFFATSAVNGTNNTVYGLFLCRGDQDATACNDCVKTATTTDLPQKCPNRKVAVIWYDQCILRYSDNPLVGIMSRSPDRILYNIQNITGNQTLFTDTLGIIMNDLTDEASSSKSGKKYATKAARYNSLSSLYAMQQCTPDLSIDDCSRCLRIATGKLLIKMGAQVLQPSCLVRYETNPFYNGDANTSSPSPSPSPGTNSPVGNENNGGCRLRQLRDASGWLGWA